MPVYERQPEEEVAEWRWNSGKWKDSDAMLIGGQCMVNDGQARWMMMPAAVTPDDEHASGEVADGNARCPPVEERAIPNRQHHPICHIANISGVRVNDRWRYANGWNEEDCGEVKKADNGSRLNADRAVEARTCGRAKKI